MLKERENAIARISLIIQVSLTVLLFSVVCKLFNNQEQLHIIGTAQCVIFSILIIPVWGLLIGYSGLDRMSRDQRYRYLFFRYFNLVSAGTLFLYIVSLIAGSLQVHFKLLLLFAGADFLVLFLYKAFFFSVMRFFRRRGYNTRQVVVYADNKSQKCINNLLETVDWGYKIRGVITSSEEIREEFGGRVKILSPDISLDKVLDRSIVDEVYYCKGLLDKDEIAKLIDVCAEVGVLFKLKTSPWVIGQLDAGVEVPDNAPLMEFGKMPGSYAALKMKRFFDVLFSFFAIIITSPLFFVVALLIKLDDGGPIFFKQERVGLNGRRFKLLKFRTMIVNAESLQKQLMGRNEQTGPVFKIKRDPRITRVGKFLRKTSLDEFPQFFNVISGDMSVVGPRPPIPAEVKQYERWQSRRLSMKPGITCIWQVSGRNTVDFDEWMKMDLKYIDNWSLKLDFSLILKTVKVIILGEGQ